MRHHAGRHRAAQARLRRGRAVRPARPLRQRAAGAARPARGRHRARLGPGHQHLRRLAGLAGLPARAVRARRPGRRLGLRQPRRPGRLPDRAARHPRRCAGRRSAPRRHSPGDARGLARRRRPAARLRRRGLALGRAALRARSGRGSASWSAPSATASSGPGSSPRPARPGHGRSTTSSSRSRCSRPTPRSTPSSTTRAAQPVVDATTFGKWGPELAAVVGDGPLTVVGVATDCCVISTVLPPPTPASPSASSATPAPARRRRPRTRAAGDEPLRAAGARGRPPPRCWPAMIPAAPDGPAARRLRRPAVPDGPPAAGRRAARRLAAAADAAVPPGAGTAGRRPARRPGRRRPPSSRPGCSMPGSPSPTCRRARRTTSPWSSRSGTGRRARPPARGAARGPGHRGPSRWSWSTTARWAGHGSRASGCSGTPAPAARRRRATPGCATATTPFVAFLDSDCVPQPGWLERLRPHLDDPGWPPSRRGSSPCRTGAPGWLGAYEAAASALDMGPDPAPVRPLSAVSYVPSAALLARRDALGDGFDETMRVAEDVDLVWRLAAAGWRVRYEPRGTGGPRAPRPDGGLAAAARLLRDRRGAARRPARRRGRAGRARAGVGAGLGAGGRRRPAGRGRGGRRPRASPRSGWPGGCPAGRAAAAGFAAALVLRGQGASGRALARAVTRHHWPLAVAAAVVSRRARRGVLAVAAATRRSRGGRSATGWDRSVSCSPAGWTTSPTAPASGGAPCGPGTPARSLPARPPAARSPVARNRGWWKRRDG